MNDERVAKLTQSARVLLVGFACHCASELTDGRIPEALLPVLYAEAKAKPRHLQELVDAGLVEKLPISDGYYLPAYLTWNPTKADLEAERDAGRRRVAEFRERQKAHRRLRSA